MPQGAGDTVIAVEKQNMGEIYITHGAVQKSLSNLPLYGLVNPDKKVVVKLGDDNNGPRFSPGEYSVCDLLTKIYLERPRGYAGGYIAFFSGVNKVVSQMAKEIASDPAAWLRFYLLRRGWKWASVK